MTLPVYHFYHCYADGCWQVPAAEHVAVLTGSGFRAEQVTVGLVGCEERAAEARSWFTRELEPVGPVRFVTALSGFEQVTLRAARTWAGSLDGDGAVLYCHTKGAYNPSPASDQWRQVMTRDVAAGWKECVELLDDFDATGPFWMFSADYQLPFFGGNFWWARASYLARLPEVPGNLLHRPGEDPDSRWDAEVWVAMGSPRVMSLRPWGSW